MSNYTKNTDGLRKMILENPDLPIVILADNEIAKDDSFNSWVAPDARFYIGEILDCEQDINDERIYSDRDDFEEDLQDCLADSGDYDETTDEEFDAVVKAKLAEYEPYWKKVIIIHATT